MVFLFGKMRVENHLKSLKQYNISKMNRFCKLELKHQSEDLRAVRFTLWNETVNS